MGTVWIREFTGGLDTRKLVETSRGGTLIRAEDCHINRGGEVEQRAAFVKFADLPQGATTGLAATLDRLLVFGSGAAPALPGGIGYQQIAVSEGQTLERIESWSLFTGKVYAAARLGDGSIEHYYGAARVTAYGSNTAIRPGAVVRTFGQKLNFLEGSNLIFSALNDPTSYDASNSAKPGAGFFDLSVEDYGSEALVGMGRYQNYLAVFSSRAVQVRYMDPDPKLSKAVQTLQNTGTLAARSITQFGDNDLFYLDSSGVRSLRARDASNAAVTTDIGSAIDTLVTDSVVRASDEQIARAIGLIEPRDGRYWLILADQIFVFSYFPSAKVSAWTVYKPGFLISDAVVFKRRVYARSDDAIYVYGGLDEAYAYDDTPAVVWTPYLDADRPTERKSWNGIDVACRGTWDVAIAWNPAPSMQHASDRVGEVTETTYAENRIPAENGSTHFSVRLTSKAAPPGGGPCIVSAVVAHYQSDEKDEARS
ncbi:MAG: hypothetical protein WAP03_19335 [Methylorubrum rhodinum]|uniref:hypothetical protein n=1 Tax=Methylorubrum rhodinum TaxID=29428 RepID=UPI003BB13060